VVGDGVEAWRACGGAVEHVDDVGGLVVAVLAEPGDHDGAGGLRLVESQVGVPAVAAGSVSLASAASSAAHAGEGSDLPTVGLRGGPRASGGQITYRAVIPAAMVLSCLRTTLERYHGSRTMLGRLRRLRILGGMGGLPHYLPGPYPARRTGSGHRGPQESGGAVPFLLAPFHLRRNLLIPPVGVAEV
jgi:hypothetical protein